VFNKAQDLLKIPRGSVRATVLIETILAAFEMDEILYELRDHSAGLKLRPVGLHLLDHQEAPRPCCLHDARPGAGHDDDPHDAVVLAARDPDVPPAGHPCHRRHGAQIPIKDDPTANEEALAKVRADKEREAGDGHDGTWVAHRASYPSRRRSSTRRCRRPTRSTVRATMCR